MRRFQWLAGLALSLVVALSLLPPTVAGAIEPPNPGTIAAERFDAPRAQETVEPQADQPPGQTALSELGGYEIPLGYFFPLNFLNGKPDYGYGVDDGAGIPFWTEYQRLDGPTTLGRPSSRRSVWDEQTVQQFDRGVLRWMAETNQADVVPLNEVGTPPAAALMLQSPAIVEGWMAQPVWSGWWWPATSAVGPPHLYDSGGPLDKYDRYVAWRTGVDPGTLIWERTMLLPDGGPSWAGHCNGWAAASILEPEPIAPVEAGPITFTVSDLKGLLSDYHFADSALWLHGGAPDGVSALDFHRQIASWMVRGGQGMVVVFSPGGDEIWSYPAYRVQLRYGADRQRPDVTHVVATLWMADPEVPAQFVGIQNYPSDAGKRFEYILEGDRDAPTDASWEGVSLGGGFSRPFQIWYPEPSLRNVYRELTSPNLDYAMIQEILSGGHRGDETPSEIQDVPAEVPVVEQPATGLPDGETEGGARGGLPEEDRGVPPDAEPGSTDGTEGERQREPEGAAPPLESEPAEQPSSEPTSEALPG